MCKVTSECNKYAFSTLSEVVIRDPRVVIRDLQVVIRDLQRNNVWIIKFQTNGTFSLALRITVYLKPPILATSTLEWWMAVSLTIVHDQYARLCRSVLVLYNKIKPVRRRGGCSGFRPPSF
jgi:hypothetical protein